MMVTSVVLLALGAVLTSAFPTDHVISKTDPGPRYQYMAGPDGTSHLVDLWLKSSDVLKSARYTPESNNGYHLFTRSNPFISQPIPFGADATLRTSNFDANKKTVFIVHGWRNTPTSDFNVYMINAYIQAEDVNLIMVDWSVGAVTDYLVALNNAIRSGEHVARYINWLNAASGASLANYHIVGHSLGGHQAGIIGRHLGGQVPYITGLDPALPGWILNTNAIRASDSLYTEIIHTDAGFSGIINPAGHVDFYPNGGRSMPGCSDNSCSHHRCVFYMAESLVAGGFTGRQCDSTNDALNGNCNSSTTLRMGGITSKAGSSGIFYLTTNANSPYSQG